MTDEFAQAVYDFEQWHQKFVRENHRDPNRHDTWQAAYRAGQEAMREKCASAVTSRLVYTGQGGYDPEKIQAALAQAIRFLPTDAS